jgi:hypothetical protein
MRHVIFYSWQADLPNSTNRGFIQTALEDAARTIAADLNIEPVIERDTQNVPGSPDIANTIFRKISTSHAFVADITLINPKSAKRRTPNPNVLLELGYALHALGEDRIILVCNRAYGPLEALPFDLKMRRVIPYDMPEDGTERAPERKRLASILAHAIKAALASIPQVPPAPNDVDAAITAIEAAAPNRALLIRRAMSALTKELQTVAPPRFLDGATVAQLLEALHRTAPAVRAFTRLSEAIAAMNDTDAARALYKALSTILEHYQNPRRFEGRFDERDFDYWKFLGHELIVTLFATLLIEERYAIIKDLLDETITIANHRYQSGNTPVTYEYASEYLRSLELTSREKQRTSLHADLLHERHGNTGDHGLSQDGPLADVLPLGQFMAADYLLWLRGELAPTEDPTEFFEWYPWSSLYLHDTPDFMHSAIRGTTATALATALNVPDVPEFKERLQRRAGRIGRMWPSDVIPRAVRQEDIERIGTKS